MGMVTLPTCIILALLLFIEFAFSIFAPGFFLVRHLSLDPDEKGACSVAASFFFLYLFSFLLFILKLPAACHFLFTLGGALLAWTCRDDLRRYFSLPEVKRLFLCFVALLIWTGTLLALVHNYSGSGWTGDWFEHYQRAIFFLRQEPLDKHFFGGWVVPARPPLFNLVSAHFLVELRDSFPVYQVSAMVLNLSVFFPASLFFRKLAPQASSGPLSLAILMGLNPSVMENATYTWTKLLAAFYVLLGVWFYFRSLEKRDALSLHLAFASVSMGTLTHYSAVPYMLVLAAHYLWRRLFEVRWKEMAGVLALNSLILLTWFGWSLSRYPTLLTFNSNNFMIDASRFSLVPYLGRIAGNLRDTLVPPFLRTNDPWQHFAMSWATLADYSFALYHVNLFIAMGVVGWLIAARQAIKLGRRVTERSLLYFWVWFVLGAIVLGIAAVGHRDESGAAHLDLQPLMVLGVILVAAAWATLPRALLLLTSLGVCCDFAVGIVLHFAVEHGFFSWSLNSVGSRINWQIKQANHLTFLGDVWPMPLLLAQGALLGVIIYRLWRSRGGKEPQRTEHKKGLTTSEITEDRDKQEPWVNKPGNRGLPS